MGTCHAMGGDGHTHVAAEGCRMGMGTNSKEMLGSSAHSHMVD